MEQSLLVPLPTSSLRTYSVDEENTVENETSWHSTVFSLGSSPLPASPDADDGYSSASNALNGATGIDTLKLFYPLRLRRRPSFTILQRSQVSGPDVGEGYLWRDPQGQLAYGALAVRRAGPFRFRIGPVGTEIKLRAFFSAPAVAYGTNARAITQSDLQGVLEYMQAVLCELGLDIDWEEGQVSRVDIHRDVALPRPFHFYLAALQLIEPRYGRIYQNYPTGMLRGAATRLVYNLYDKRVQCQKRGIALPAETYRYPAWMRCEARLPTAAATRDSLGVSTAAELVQRFEELSPWLDERVRKDLLSEEVPDYIGCPLDPTPTFTPDNEIWWRAQLSGPSEDFKDRMAFLALRLAYTTVGPQRFWELARQECYGDNLPVSKLRSQSRQTALGSLSDEMVPLAQLYEELRTALLNPTS